MMTDIVFDLDGVLRDIVGYLVMKFKIPYPENWFWNYKSKNIFDWVEYDNFKVLKESLPTIFYHNFSHQVKEIWTCQPDSWLPYTMLWIEKYLPKRKVRILETEEKEKLLYSRKNTYLVEDGPNFKNYDRIILVDRLYNRHIKCKNRINEEWGRYESTNRSKISKELF